MAEGAAEQQTTTEIAVTNPGYIRTIGGLLLVAGMLCYLFLPGLLSPLLALLFFIALTYVLPFGTLLLLVLTLPLHYVLRRSSVNLSLSDLLLISSIGGLIVKVYWRALLTGGAELLVPVRRAVRSPYFFPTLAWVLLATFSILFLTDHSGAPIAKEDSALKIGLRDYSEILEPIAVYAMVLISIRDRRSLWILTDVYFVTGVALAVAGLVRAAELIVNPPPQMETFFRAEALFPQPNVLALYMSLTIPFFAALTISLKGQKWRRRIYFVGLLMMGAVDVMTGSRGGWVAVVAGLILLALLTRKFIWLAPVLVAGAVGVVILALTGNNRSLSALVDINSGSGNTRSRLWKAAIEEIRRHPLLGDGLGNISWMHRYIPSSRLVRTELLHSHNIVLDFWTKLGVGGVIAIFWLLIAYFIQAWRTFRHSDPMFRAFGLALIVAMAASFVHGLVDVFYFALPLSVLFWMMLGLAEIIGKDYVK